MFSVYFVSKTVSVLLEPWLGLDRFFTRLPVVKYSHHWQAICNTDAQTPNFRIFLGKCTDFEQKTFHCSQGLGSLRKAVINLSAAQLYTRFIPVLSVLQVATFLLLPLFSACFALFGLGIFVHHDLQFPKDASNAVKNRKLEN